VQYVKEKSDYKNKQLHCLTTWTHSCAVHPHVQSAQTTANAGRKFL